MSKPAIVGSDEPRRTAHRDYAFQYRYLESSESAYEPILLLGGAFQTMRSLEKFARVLMAHTSVILVDLPGSGDSDLPPPHMGAEFLAGCLRRVVDDLHLPQVNFVGVSFGTAIGYTAARLYPDRMRNLVLIGTMSRIDDQIEKALMRSLEALGSESNKTFSDRVSSVLMNHSRKKDIVDFERAERLLRVAVERMRKREREQFQVNSERLLLHRELSMEGALEPRTLVFTGEHDSVTTPACCREVVQTAREGYLVLVEGADHLVPLERLDVCAQLVDSFLRGGSLETVPGCASHQQFGQLSPAG